MENELESTAPTSSRRLVRQLQGALLTTFVMAAAALALAVFITLASR
jgi:hypothetical protein